MVLKTQSSLRSMASKTQLPQVIDQKSIIINRKNTELPLFFDRCFDKNRIKTFIGWLLTNFGENATVYVVEKLKNLGFHFATEAGISLSIDDLQVPSNKNWFLSQAEKDIKRNQNNFQCGNLTPVEQSQQLLDRWHRTSEILRESVIQSFRLTNTLNPVYMMAFSGARGNISQVRQLVGMRGLMADPQGQIISFPIRSNFREGLTLTEYVISCYGARKGVVDTALRTADSGYLTRRLVDVSQHVVVWTFDCKTDAGIHLTEMKEGQKVILSLKKRILGRVLAQEIETIAFRNQQISAQLAQQIVSLKEHVLVRSPLSCSVPNSVCQLCYGWSLSRGRIVSLGEAVGVIAAQSIGEPGTQLTMRTFHTGGVFSGDVIDEIRAPHDGLVRFLQPLLGQLIRTSHGKIAYLTRANGSFAIENNLIDKKVLNSQESMLRAKREDFGEATIKSDPISVVPNKHSASQNMKLTVINLKPGTALFVRQGEKVIRKQLLAEYSSISAQTKERVEAQYQVYSDQKGEIFFDDVVLGKKLKKEEPEAEKGSVLNLQNQFKRSGNDFSTLPSVEQNIQKGDPQSGRKVDIVTSLKLNTLWILSGTFFEPPIYSTLYTKIGDLVDKTTLLTLIKNELNLQTSHLDGEYIFSAQLKKNKITKRREESLTFFKKSLVSSKLPKILQRRDLEDNMKKKENLFLNKFSLNLVITNLKYKKSGYFFTSYKKEKAHNFDSLFEHFVGAKKRLNILTKSKYKKQNVKAESAYLSNNLTDSKNYKENNKASNWNLISDKVETNFLSFPNSYIVTKQELFAKKEIKNIFVLVEPKQIRKTKDKKIHFGKEKLVFAEQKLREKKKNINHFFTTTSLNQPFSNCREFKNEFVLQWFSPLFKTETGGLIYTNNYYCNKRSTETHIFFIAEENYGKKDLAKMNFGRRKKSFNVVSFKELIAPSICLANVFLNGKIKPSSSFDCENAFSPFPEKKWKNQQNFFSGGIDFGKEQPEKNIMRDNKAVSINSLLNEISFLQNNNLDKELFFLRKKENLSLYSVCFPSTKTETFNTTINLLKKGFLSFKKKWVETDIPLGYQKNLQGNQIPFYSTENGVLKNNPAPSFFTNQYSNYWSRKKSKKLSGSFLKDFFPVVFKDPLPHIKVKNRDFYRKKGFFADNLYLNKNELFGQNDILIKNFNRKSSNEKLYQKIFWLADQQKRVSKRAFFFENKELILKSTLNFNPAKTKFYERKPSSLYSKDKIRFSLPLLLTRFHLNLTKNKASFHFKNKITKLSLLSFLQSKKTQQTKILKFNPFPSKGNYASSAFLFRINMRASFSSDLQKGNSLFYNPYPYSQPIFAEFLQNKSAANPYYLRKRLKIDLDLQNKSKADAFALHSTQQNVQKQKQEKNLKNLKVVEDSKFPQNLVSFNNSQNQGSTFCETKCKEDALDQKHQDKKFNKFSSFLQKQIQKVSTKKQKRIGENLQKSDLQIRPGWLYLPKDQFQIAKAHQSFIAPFQQNIDEILFDQFPIYIESILRKNFEEQLVDKYLQPSTNVVDSYKTKTLVEKSQLQKFINQISTVSTKPKQSVQGLKISRERSNKFLLSLRETFWRGSTFSSFVENDFTTFYDNKKNISKLNVKIDFGKEKDNLYQTNLPTNFLNHTKISSTSSFLSFLLRNKKERKIKYLQEKNTFSRTGIKEKCLFLRPVSINPIKIVFQVVTNKSCRFNSIQSFALSCVNDINFDFSQDFFLQSRIIDKNLNQNETCIEKNINPGFFLCLPQISRIYFVKNKPFSDFVLVPRQLNFDQVQIKSHIFSDEEPVSYRDENEVSNLFLKENQNGKGTIVTGYTSVGEVSGETLENNTSDIFDQIKSKEQNWTERLTLSEKNKNLICRGRQILIPINKTSKMISFDEAESRAVHFMKQNVKKMLTLRLQSKELNKYQNLSKTLQNQTFLIQNFSTKADTNYFSFLVSIPNSLKNKRNSNIVVSNAKMDFGKAQLPHAITNIPEHSVPQNVEQIKNSVFDKISSFQKKKPSFFQFFSEKSKLWLLIRKVDEYPLLDTSIFQQKTRLYKGNQTFFEKELIYSSTPLSLYMSNRITFSSKFNKQKKKEIYLSFYHSPKVSLKIKEKTVFLLNTFSKLEKQHFVNLSTVLKAQLPQTSSLTKSRFFDKVKFGVSVDVGVLSSIQKKETKNNETKNNEDKLKLPFNLFSGQKIFWQIFDLHRQNMQKSKFFEGKQPLFVKKNFDAERKDLLKDNLPFQENQLYYKVAAQNKIWFFQKASTKPSFGEAENKENLENTLFSCQNAFWHQEKEKEQTIIRSFKQSYLLHFFLNFHTSKQSPLQRIEIKTTFEKIEGSTQTSSCAHYLNLQETHTNTKNDFFINRHNVRICDLDLQNKKTEYLQNQNEIKLKSLQEKLKVCKYSFTPFARDLSFTLSFTAKLNQSWFFSLANNVKNKTGALSFEEAKALRDLESSTFQSQKLIRETFISTSKTLLNEKKTKQEYFKNKKSISKKSSSYPLKEKPFHTTLLLDQTITTYDKTLLAITALMSKEEGEIENLKNNSASLILKNSDIEILLTKKEKPLVVVGQLIRYGEQIANGIAAPKSGQIIQVDSNRVTLRKAQPILFPRGGSVDVNHGDYVKEGSPLLSLSYQRLVTGDIVQGIPKIEQLFEARETEGGQPLLSSLHSELEAIFLSYSTQLGLKLAVRESFKEIQQIIVDRVQRVYIAQGVLIADKHFEVVIRQMTSKVRILDGGRPGFLYGELVDLRRVELLNAGVPFANEQALYEPIILGISKACLEAEGFLSPASFQETTRVLSLAAIERKTDFLRGIKERVILGDVIQAGTGFTLYDRPVRKIKQEECIDLSLSVLHDAHSTLSTNQYYKQL